uniref:Neuronal tyrosine-phosphorylated phosphoinositide-3-kinase adaptor 2 n=1 Tax=Sander lucioperca TaxID=283035 RepID=A0A8D0AQ59_SANLU
MMSSKEEETLCFFQYVEENGLRAYNGLVAQNLDHARNERNRTFLQEKNDKKRKQEEAIRRTGEDIATEGKHLRMGSITMPDPQERMPMPHPHALACGQGFSVRSQSLHSVGGGNSGGGGEEEVGSPTSRKQPPPKPRRDPATKLSMSSEAVDHSPTSTCRGERLHRLEQSWMPKSIEDCRRVPPPKPKRNPNTQLSVSFDESYIKSHGGSGVCPSRPIHYVSSPCERNPSPPQSDESPTDDCEDEPVYIEMGGIDVGAREPLKSEDEEPGESVYEEMKYPALDDMEYRTDPVGCRSACPTPAPYDPEPLSRCSTPRNIPLCDIPAPFPNLLTHRPPLLVFPPAPAQCSPNSDESPLTPLEVAKLPMLENQSYSKSPTSSTEPPSSAHIRRELTATPTLTVSGRSSAPPLPCTLYKSSSSSSYQRSHSACPSPVSMGRCLTPLSLMRTPPFEAPMPFPGGLPRSASATPHGKGSPPQDGVSRLHGSMQNVSTGRSRTPTSPLDELTNLFTTGRNMLKKNASGRKSKEPGESESFYTFVSSFWNVVKQSRVDHITFVYCMWQEALLLHMTKRVISPPFVDLKAAPKYGRSHSIPANPSPMGTPQRKAAETHQSQVCRFMPWICGDTTMLEQIERKRTLCMEIRSRQHPHLQCKQESASVLPGWGKSNGAKKIRPPPYPTQKTVFWDTAI